MPSSPPLTPHRPTRGPESNLVSTSTERGTLYETGYNTVHTGGPGNVISNKSPQEQAKDRRGTFGAGEESSGGGGQARQYFMGESETLERQEETAGSGGSCGVELLHRWQEEEPVEGGIQKREGSS